MQEYLNFAYGASSCLIIFFLAPLLVKSLIYYRSEKFKKYFAPIIVVVILVPVQGACLFFGLVNTNNLSKNLYLEEYRLLIMLLLLAIVIIGLVSILGYKYIDKKLFKYPPENISK